MAGSFLVDTNMTIALFNQEPNVLKKMERAEKVFVPWVVLGELFFGLIGWCMSCMG